MSWTEEKITALRQYWGQGLSASQIADRIGDVTRNAVIGKAHRLALDARPSPIRALAPGEQPRPRAPRKPRTRLPRLALGGLKTTNGQRPRLNGSGPRLGREANGSGAPRHDLVRQAAQLYIASVNGPGCKWPIGDPRDADFHFCNHPSAIGRPYCPDHCAVAYIRKEQRNAA